jgi:hypothetical protein
MSEIRTFEDLEATKKQLQTQLAIQKEVIRQDFIELRDEFRPAVDLVNTLGKLTGGIKKPNPLVAMGIGVATDLFLTNNVLARSGSVTRMVIPFLVKKVSGFLIGNENGLFKKLASKFSARSNGKRNGIH